MSPFAAFKVSQRVLLGTKIVSLTSLNEVTTVISLPNKYDNPPTSPADSRYKPKKSINKPKRIPFITTFNPSLPHISNIIKKHYNLLLSSNRCKNVFQHLPVVAFRRSPNLRDLLVTAKLSSNSSNPQLPSGSFRCGKNYATCP